MVGSAQATYQYPVNMFFLSQTDPSSKVMLAIPGFCVGDKSSRDNHKTTNKIPNELISSSTNSTVTTEQ